jgi:hypothetical protein
VPQTQRDEVLGPDRDAQKEGPAVFVLADPVALDPDVGSPSGKEFVANLTDEVASRELRRQFVVPHFKMSFCAANGAFPSS